MSDVSNVTVRIKTQITEEPKTVQLERFVTVAGNDVKRRLKCPVIEDQACPELTLYMHTMTSWKQQARRSSALQQEPCDLSSSDKF